MKQSDNVLSYFDKILFKIINRNSIHMNTNTNDDTF